MINELHKNSQLCNKADRCLIKNLIFYNSKNLPFFEHSTNIFCPPFEESIVWKKTWLTKGIKQNLIIFYYQQYE